MFLLFLFQTLEDTVNAEGNEELEREFVNEIENTESITSPLSTPLMSRASSRASTSTTSIKRKKNDRSDEVLDIIAKSLQQNASAQTQPLGRYTSYGQHVAQELNDLPQSMATFCKKVINEALFQAQLGNLTEHSRIVNDQQAKPSTIQSKTQRVEALQGYNNNYNLVMPNDHSVMLPSANILQDMNNYSQSQPPPQTVAELFSTFPL